MMNALPRKRENDALPINIQICLGAVFHDQPYNASLRLAAAERFLLRNQDGAVEARVAFVDAAEAV